MRFSLLPTTGERSTMLPISSKDTAKVSCGRNAIRSAAFSLSSTTSSARATSGYTCYISLSVSSCHRLTFQIALGQEA